MIFAARSGIQVEEKETDFLVAKKIDVPVIDKDKREDYSQSYEPKK